MAESLEEYINLFRESHVEDQQKLLGIHIVIYAVVNAIWVMLNALFVESRYRWLVLYPIIGWGALIFVHYWFYVRNADKLCRIREERAVTKMARGLPIE
jgi:hypothetical protein